MGVNDRTAKSCLAFAAKGELAEPPSLITSRWLAEVMQMGGAGMRRPAILTVLVKDEDGPALRAAAAKGATVTVRQLPGFARAAYSTRVVVQSAPRCTREGPSVACARLDGTVLATRLIQCTFT